MLNGKVMVIHLIVELIKKIQYVYIFSIFSIFSYVFKNTISSYKMSQYFPKPYEPFCGDTNVKVDLSNYAAKADIKNISHVDTSSLALKINLVNLKTEVDKLDIDK